MAVAKNYPLVVPFCAVMFNDESLRDKAIKFLHDELGKIAKLSSEVNFSAETDYYDSEMGGDIKKVYMIFEAPMKREHLAKLKLKTNEFEKQHSAANEKRQINLDPGYVTKDKFVLASAKDYFHRIAIGNGIFAEATLHFEANNKIRRFSWTYSDYLINEIQDLLIFGRKLAFEIK